jgi:preprotein translocase subunit SecB
MKSKISPEEYRSILGSIILDTLYLVEINAKYNEEYVSQSLNLDVKEKYNFTQENNILKIFYNYNLTAKDGNADKPAMFIKAKYVIKYDIIKETNINKEFMEIFSDMTLSLLLWTYFRELVNNTVYRMGMPPLVLQMKRI